MNQIWLPPPLPTRSLSLRSWRCSWNLEAYYFQILISTLNKLSKLSFLLVVMFKLRSYVDHTEDNINIVLQNIPDTIAYNLQPHYPQSPTMYNNLRFGWNERVSMHYWWPHCWGHIFLFVVADAWSSFDIGLFYITLSSYLFFLKASSSCYLLKHSIPRFTIFLNAY